MDVHKTIVISANLGNFDKPQPHVKQTADCDFYTFTDDNFPPRVSSMTPRLQARIPKMFSWQLKPGYDYYLWIDSSCRLSHPSSVQWFLDQLDDRDVAVFKHPHRQTIQEEADYLKKRLAKDCPYITPRYKNEDIDGQLKEVITSQMLFASTAFIYKNSPKMQEALKEWWYHTSRFHSIDQLSLPMVLSNVDVKVIDENYLKIPYLEYTRNK